MKKTLPKPYKGTKPSIDLGLTALVEHAKRGQTMTIKDIAEVCECSRRMITDLEASALAKYEYLMMLRLGRKAIELHLA